MGQRVAVARQIVRDRVKINWRTLTGGARQARSPVSVQCTSADVIEKVVLQRRQVGMGDRPRVLDLALAPFQLLLLHIPAALDLLARRSPTALRAAFSLGRCVDPPPEPF